MNQQNNLTASENLEALAARKPANPCILVIFGIAGDLTKRLLYPALCNLGSAGLLDPDFCIVGIARKPYDDQSFREELKKNIDTFVIDPASKQYGLALAERVHYIRGDLNDANTYTQLNNQLENLSVQKASKNYLFYFAVLPEFIDTIAKQLSNAKLLIEENNNFRRMVVEKPFGHDLDSAQQLNKNLLAVANEQQIFRIDHFLGKETVQNILALRFSNSILEPIWNRKYIDNVQITVAEVLGVETRGNYYERAGALRDMVQNHLLQMLSLLTMEPPVAFTANYISDEKIKALHAIPFYTPQQVLERAVRGQYGPGKINNVDAPGYRSEADVAAQSPIETYAALKLFLDNWRWLNVPFYLRTGKRMKARTSEIIIQFKSGPSSLFRDCGQKTLPNLLRIYIQPEEGISLDFNAKIPGPIMQLAPVDMKFKYSDYFGIKPQTGYETILYDCMNGDHLLFNHADMVEISWAIMQPILDVWNALTPRDFPNYAAGTWGPKEADELLLKDGRAWLL